MKKLLLASAALFLLAGAFNANAQTYGAGQQNGGLGFGGDGYTNGSSSGNASSGSEYLTKKEKRQWVKAAARGDMDTIKRLNAKAARAKEADNLVGLTGDDKFGGSSSSHGSHNPAGCGGGCQRSGGYD